MILKSMKPFIALVLILMVVIMSSWCLQLQAVRLGAATMHGHKWVAGKHYHHHYHHHHGDDSVSEEDAGEASTGSGYRFSGSGSSIDSNPHHGLPRQQYDNWGNGGPKGGQDGNDGGRH